MKQEQVLPQEIKNKIEVKAQEYATHQVNDVWYTSDNINAVDIKQLKEKYHEWLKENDRYDSSFVNTAFEFFECFLKTPSHYISDDVEKIIEAEKEKLFVAFGNFREAIIKQSKL